VIILDTNVVSEAMRPDAADLGVEVIDPWSQGAELT
jgi:predicted nucleic acid-binding protein